MGVTIGGGGDLGFPNTVTGSTGHFPPWEGAALTLPAGVAPPWQEAVATKLLGTAPPWVEAVATPPSGFGKP